MKYYLILHTSNLISFIPGGEVLVKGKLPYRHVAQKNLKYNNFSPHNKSNDGNAFCITAYFL